MGRVLTAGDDDWPVVVGNLRKARKIWMRTTRILIRDGEDPKISGLFFKAFVQAVLIFGAETWVLTPPDGEGTEQLPEKGCATAHREAAEAEGGGGDGNIL